jgi:beta-glucosidase
MPSRGFCSATSTRAENCEDYPDWGNYPGSNGVVTYAEGVYIGYRHFDKRAIAPMFPFGFGLSYTSFGYGGLKIPHHDRRDQATTISVTVQNTGARAGDEIAQLYIEPVAPKIDRPVRELKGFQRVSLLPGEKKTLSFPLDARSFAYWDVKTHAWQTDPGTYVVEVGSSSRDIRVKEAMTVR